MRTFHVTLMGVASAATCILASGSKDFMQHYTPQMNKRLRASKTLHAPPSKRSPATDDVQASIVAQALTDPVQAAIAAQGLDGIKDNIDGGDQANGALIQGDSESAANPADNQYSWNQAVTFVPNADATPGTGADEGWQALPQLDGFDLVRDQAIVENATQVRRNHGFVCVIYSPAGALPAALLHH